MNFRMDFCRKKEINSVVLKSRENSIFDYSRDSVRNFAKMKSAQSKQNNAEKQSGNSDYYKTQ